MSAARTKRTPQKRGRTAAVSTKPAWPDRFLAHMKELGNIEAAARATPIGRTTVYAEMDRDPEFKKAVADVRFECAGVIESTLFLTAQDPDKTTDRIFWMKHNLDGYSEKLSPEEADALRAEGRTQLMTEIEERVVLLTPNLQPFAMTLLFGSVAEVKALSAGVVA